MKEKDIIWVYENWEEIGLSWEELSRFWDRYQRIMEDEMDRRENKLQLDNFVNKQLEMLGVDLQPTQNEEKMGETEQQLKEALIAKHTKDFMANGVSPEFMANIVDLPESKVLEIYQELGLKEMSIDEQIGRYRRVNAKSTQ